MSACITGRPCALGCSLFCALEGDDLSVRAWRSRMALGRALEPTNLTEARPVLNAWTRRTARP